MTTCSLPTPRASFVQIVSIQGFFYQQQGRTGRRKGTTCSENALMKAFLKQFYREGEFPFKEIMEMVFNVVM